MDSVKNSTASASALFALCSQDDLIALLPKQKQNKIKKAIIDFNDSNKKIQEGLKVIKQFKKVHNKQIKRQEKAKETIKEINKLLRKIKKEKEQQEEEIEQLSERESIESDETKDINIKEYESDDEKSAIDDENSIYYEFDLNKKDDIAKLNEYMMNYNIDVYSYYPDGTFRLFKFMRVLDTYFKEQHTTKNEYRYIKDIKRIINYLNNDKIMKSIKYIRQYMNYSYNDVSEDSISEYLCNYYIKMDETTNNKYINNLCALLYIRANNGTNLETRFYSYLEYLFIKVHTYYLEGKGYNVDNLYNVAKRELHEEGIIYTDTESEQEDDAPPIHSESEQEDNESGYYIGGSNVKWCDTESESEDEEQQNDTESEQEEEQIKYNLNYLCDENYLRVESEQINDNRDSIDFYDLENTKKLNHLVKILFLTDNIKIAEENDNLYYHFTELKELRKRYKKTKKYCQTATFKKFKYNQLLHLTIEMMENKYNVDRLNINHFMKQYKIIPNGDFTNPYNLMALYYIMMNNNNYDKNEMKSYILYFYAKCLYNKHFNNIMLDFPENEDESGNIIYEYTALNKYDKKDMIKEIERHLNIEFINIKDLIIKFMKNEYAEINDDYKPFYKFLNKSKYTQQNIEKFINKYFLYDGHNEHIKKVLNHLRIKEDDTDQNNNIIPLIYAYLTLKTFNELDYLDYHITNCMTLLMYCFCELCYIDAYINDCI